MSNQIKSSYILKYIYSFIVEIKKLKIIQHSKSIQNKLNISLINYKLISGKYRIGKNNGICKIYDYKDNLIFEGEYLNGKKHGKGKEYNKYGELLFEGEYLNGKKWNGKGYYINIKKYCNDKNYRIENEKREIFDDSNIYYEIKDGKGLMIDYNDEDYIFEGEYLNGERNGYGRDYKLFKNCLFIYEGEYLNGKRHGKGKEYLNTDIQTAISGSARLIFEGEYLLGKRWNGKGYNGNNKIAYELKNGVGNVKEYYYYNLIFEGEYINGERNGKGIEYIFNRNSAFPDRSPDRRYEGNYSNGKKHGIGKEYKDKETLIFQGDYLYNYKIKGTEYYNDSKIKYIGEYLFNQKWNGKGYDKNGNIIYEIINGTGTIKDYYNNVNIQGEFLNGKGNIIKFYNNRILQYEGGYKYGEKNGIGREYDFNIYGILEILEIIFEGEFLNGRRYNGKGKDTFGDLTYIGEYSKGQISGKGALYWGDINLFEGEFVNGKRWKGIGKEYLKTKKKFYDEYYHKIFEGEYLNGEKNGKGKEYYFNDKIKFDGEYINGLKWNGKEYEPNNFSFTEIKNGNGLINEYDYSGNILFSGTYLNGRKLDGNNYFKNLSIYPIKNGKGQIKEYKYISPDEEIILEGEYINGQKNGKWKEYSLYQSSIYLEFEGEYLDGLKYGIGKTYSNGNLIFEGEYSNGKIKIIKNGRIQKKQETLVFLNNNFN